MRYLLILCAIHSLWGLIGCGSQSSKEVIVYVSVDRRDAEPILRSFEQKHGIRVRAIYDSEAAKTTGLVTRLIAEKEQPRCDVFWNNEHIQTHLLAKQGLLTPYSSPSLSEIPEQYKSDEGLWAAVATRARVIVYNTKYVSPKEVPQSVFQLAEPRWKGKVAMADPQFGTTRTHVAALYAQLGKEEAKQLLTALTDNQIQIVSGNAVVRERVARARPTTSPIYLGLTDTDDVVAGISEGNSIDMVFPDQQTIGTLIIPSTVCKIRRGPNSQEANQLIDYLLSTDVQQSLAKSNAGYSPVSFKKQGSPVLSMPIDNKAVLDNLLPSTHWTAENFQP